MDKLTFEQELLGLGELPTPDIQLDPVKDFLERARFEPPAAKPVDEPIPYFAEGLADLPVKKDSGAVAAFGKACARMFGEHSEELREALQIGLDAIEARKAELRAQLQTV